MIDGYLLVARIRSLETALLGSDLLAPFTIGRQDLPSNVHPALGPHLNYVPARLNHPATQALRDWHMLMQAKDAINHVALARTLERPSVFHLIDAFPKAQSHPPPARRNVHYSPAATFSPAVANTPAPSPNFGTLHQANYVDPFNPVDPTNQGFHCTTCAASGVTNLVNLGEFCRICGTPGSPDVTFQAVTQPTTPPGSYTSHGYGLLRSYSSPHPHPCETRG